MECLLSLATVEPKHPNHMTTLPRLLAITVFLATAGCAAGNVYLPHEPGGAASDLSGPPDRELWLAENPDTSDEIEAAILEGVLVVGMTVEHRDVVSNTDRRSTTGYGYWRSRELADQLRFQWFVSGIRQPFIDGRNRPICELVYVDDLLTDIRYCRSEPAGN